MKSKKIKYTILVSSSLLGGAILGGVVANNQAIVVHADTNTAATKTTSEVPTDQKIKISDENTKVSDNEVATSLGDKSKVNSRTDYADDNGTVVTVSAKNSDTDYVTDLGPGTMFNGETKYYAEKQDDGTWTAKSVTLTNGPTTSGTKDYAVDVSPIVDGGEVTIEQSLTDGVSVHVSSTHHETADYPALIDGQVFFVEVYGSNTYNDIQHEKNTEDDVLGTQFSDAFVNIPNTFHYYENGQLMTGILNLTYGKVTTTTPETTETTKPETTTPETTETTETTKPETTTPETTDTSEPETTETTTPTTPETTVTDDTATKTDSKTPVLVPTESGNYVASGTGTPGNTINVLDEDGNTIASGTVGADGKFSITVAGDKVDYSKNYYEEEVPAVNENKGSEITATPVNNSAAKAVKLTTSKDQTKLPQTNEAGVFSLLASVAGLLGLGWLFSSKKKLS